MGNTHRRRRHRARNAAAACLLCVASIVPIAALDNATSVVVAESSESPYELPSRIRERDDDRESDVDPVEMEGMTAALAKKFAEKLVHKINVDEAVMRTSSGSTRNGWYFCWGVAGPVLLTLFLSLGHLPKLSICSSTRSLKMQHLIVATLATLAIFLTMLPLPTGALQVSSFGGASLVSRIPPNSSMPRQSSLCATCRDGDGDAECSIKSHTFLDTTRRSAISQATAAICFGTFGIPHVSHVNIASAEGSDELYLAQPLGPPGADGQTTRPSAPLEYLVPASRVGVYIYQTLAVAEEVARLQKSEDYSSAKIQEAFSKLDSLLLSPPTFIKANDPKVARGDAYQAPPLIGEIGMAAKKRRERREQSIEADFVSELFEPGQLIGERRQWNQLQKAEMKREAASEIRRALNIYTTNLNFNQNKYEFKGTKEEKSSMIRADRLPTTTDVIRSDLDSRDLYRNQMQTSLEDSKAEYLYIKKESGGDVSNADISELIGILTDAQVAIDKWFGFIATEDVKLALDAVQKEMEL